MEIRMTRGKTLMLAGAGIALLAAGCSSQPPTFASGPDADVTYDGLHEVKNSGADKAWARPDLDLSGYHKVRVVTAGMEFRAAEKHNRTAVAMNRGGPYPVTEDQKRQLAQIVTDAFVEELQKSDRYELVDASGPDVLLVHGTLLDIVSYVPPEPPGTTDIYITSVGEATLKLELRDSVTDAILVRAIDRRAAERGANRLFESSRPTNRAEVSRVAHAWARLLRTRLDQLMGENAGQTATR